jgi:hypothetical protein
MAERPRCEHEDRIELLDVAVQSYTVATILTRTLIRYGTVGSYGTRALRPMAHSCPRIRVFR